MKKIFAYLLTAVFAYAGIWLAFIANVSDAEPLSQGGLSILAAVTLCAAIVCAGWGNSLKWKGGRDNG